MQHQINMGNHQAVKQRVRHYPAARREEERKLVEDTLAIGIIHESSSAWSSPTVLVKMKDGSVEESARRRRPRGIRAVTRSHTCKPGWVPEEMVAEQAADQDVGPIGRRKLVGNDRPTWEDISPELQDTKILWHPWERLYLIRGVLHWQFHELEGQGWRYQLVVSEGRRSDLLLRLHGGAAGAHLGNARTLAPAEQGFYWPGMQADVKRVCSECDFALLKKRRGQRQPLHQYIVGAPPGPYPITSSGNQYCLMVGCYFSKWLECFPVPDQKATTVARKLVY